MAIGAALAPDPRLRVFTNLGVVAPGALLTTYAAGTGNALATYSDSALTTQNSNPVVASPSGLFGPIYLAFNRSYRFVLTESTGVAIWDQDNIVAGGSGGGSTALGPVTSTLTGTQNNFALSPGTQLLRLNNSALLTITGLAAGFDGQLLTLESVGSGQVDLMSESASSLAANRLTNIAATGATSLYPGLGSASYVYDLTLARWRLLAHEQGQSLSLPYASIVFTGGGAQTWTVQAGDYGGVWTYLQGRFLTVAWNFLTTSVAGVPNPSLQFQLPATTPLASTNALGPYFGLVKDNGAAEAVGLVNFNGTITLTLFKDLIGTTNWSAAANTTQARGQITYEVQ